MSASIAPENTLLLELDSGTVTIELLPDLAPKHVERIKALASAGFYDGTALPPRDRRLHGAGRRSQPATGTGGSDQPDLPAKEFTPPSKATFLRRRLRHGPRRQPEDSANSQFFIMFAPAPSLDGQYTIWGRVTDGMELVDRIKRGQGPNGTAREPDRIKSMRVGTAATDGQAQATPAEGVDSTPAADA
jgi:cyclophilin family peptidyl-prolyl cis-trans isomerase